ncbi:unnamed protein product [Rhizophagus irregularis]|nr:unnamed protein product [Rhizophagus irregularis]
MQAAKSDIDKYNIIKDQYEEHHKAADLERKHYNDNIEKSKQDLSIAHICYDWAQNVSIPYSPQQVGSIFFKTAYAVHLFGVCKTEEDLGKVYCSENSGGVEICHKLLRDDNNFNINEKLDILDVMHISEERKKYLYQKIRQHIEDPYKDVYYL